jgi:DNA-binding response OmpR family regulator
MKSIAIEKVHLPEATQRVLVVDDDVGLTELLAEYLRPEQFEVQSIHNGDKGLEKALSGEFSLVHWCPN